MVLFAAGSLAAGYLGIRLIRRAAPQASAPLFFSIVGLGAFALLLIAATFIYSGRKRALQERFSVGTMMAWLNAHIYLGILALVVVLAHASLFPFSTEWTSGKITTLVLLLVVVSGIGWRVVYRVFPPRVAGDVANLAIKDTQRRADLLRSELDKLRAGRSGLLQDALDDLVVHRRPAQELEQRSARLDEGEREAWTRAKEIVQSLDRESRRERRQQRYTRIMQGWRAVHIPLAVILVASIAFHLYDVFNVGRVFADAPEKHFAASEDCATCHASVVDEWKLSMHRNAQTSTITVAQTKLALSQFPEFKKACINCHAPIGVKFSQRATFPLTDDETAADPQAVGEEGVTCVVCHTMPRPPNEIEGITGELPLERRSQLSLGKMIGPPLEDPDPIPGSMHETATGFMTDSIGSSRMCAACHNVVVDIDGDGIVQKRFVETGDPDANTGTDTDGDGILDENELDIVRGELQDLALQTTFNEWEDYIASRRGRGPSCVDCHMPPTSGALLDNPPPFLSEAVRPRQTHSFVGVDYDLNAAYYTQPGMPDDAMQHVLEEREELLKRSVTMDVETERSPDGSLVATVKVRNIIGHSFPTGFAFARQFWLEVSAQTRAGKEVCLAPVAGIESPCASGKIDSPTENLATCRPGVNGANESVKFVAAPPRTECDPWLANFQKILTDGDVDDDGVFEEVPYQSLRAGIVKLRQRTADLQVMDDIPIGESVTIQYVFDTTGIRGRVDVRAVMRLRHLPPYFVRALDDFYEPGVTAEGLLENMTVVDIASNERLEETTTSPAPETFSNEALEAAPDRADRPPTDSPVRAAGSFSLWLLIVPALAMIGSVIGRASRRR
jgi:hypothetical protein